MPKIVPNTITYTVPEIAAAADVAVSTVRRWIREGRLETVYVKAKSYHCTAAAVRACLESFGRDAEPVVDALESPTSLQSSDSATVTDLTHDGPYIMGRLYAVLVFVGAETKDHLPIAAIAPSRALGHLLGKAMTLYAEQYQAHEKTICDLMCHLSGRDLSYAAIDVPARSRFWAGYYWQETRLRAVSQSQSQTQDGAADVGADADTGAGETV